MKRKWIPLGSPQAVLLLVSLCLNVLMGSYIAKQWFENWSRPVGLANEPRLIQFIADRLPSADAETFRRVYLGKEQGLRDARADYEQALWGAVRLLAQPDLDGPALRRAVLEARDKRIKIGDVVIETFLDAVPQLSPRGRQDLVGRLRNR
jgi:uncharacterized membrane protein